MIALTTCTNLPDWEVDDLPLHRALAEIDVDARVIAWDDPETRWEEFDLVLIRTTWDYTSRRVEFTEWADRVHGVTRLFNPPEVVRWNTDKGYLRDLESRGVPIVPTAWIDRGQPADLAAILDDRGWGRGFMKPAIGATSEKTMRFERREAGEAQTFIDEISRSVGVLVQPYIESVETVGELSAIFIDGEITHAVRKIPVPGDYRTQDDFGASDEPYSLSEAERDFAIRAVDAAGFDGLLYARVDFLLDESGKPRLIELELVEPSLFFRHGPNAPAKFAAALRYRARS